MTTNTKTVDLSALDELLTSNRTEEEANAKTNTTSARSGPDPERLARLKALLNGGRKEEVHESDRECDPTWVADVASLYGEIAVHARMFRRDPTDGHERAPDEVRTLVANLVRQRGTSAMFDMIIGWRGFSPRRLPKEVLATWSRLFNLPQGFFENGGAK